MKKGDQWPPLLLTAKLAAGGFDHLLDDLVTDRFDVLFGQRCVYGLKPDCDLKTYSEFCNERSFPRLP